uniref:PPM-type phosphatase domain-containing protein n=1 Tax=viral metagenome TaxID=1070528 RepID=A0A6C0JHV8_9ZZZZ
MAAILQQIENQDQDMMFSHGQGDGQGQGHGDEQGQGPMSRQNSTAYCYTELPKADTVLPDADTVLPEADTVLPDADTVLPNHTVQITSALKQMCKGQDQSFQGKFKDQETGEEGVWGMISDGHGSNSCINFLRDIKQDTLNDIVSTTRPVENLAGLINASRSIGFGESSGATMCLVKVYTDRVVCINCGDSQVAVYKNGTLEFLSMEHTSSNPSERARLERDFSGIRYPLSSNIQIINPDSLIGIKSTYTQWPNGTMLAPTQALGHRGVTGYAPDKTAILYGPCDTIQVVIGSDGLWDMVLKDRAEEMAWFADKSSEQIAEFARARWMQEWNMAPSVPEGQEHAFVKCHYKETDADDIGVVKIDVIPV